jgi:hypothetical protein
MAVGGSPMELSLWSAGSMKLLARGAGDPFPGHRLADIGREGGILDVVAGGNEILDLIVEEGEVEHAVHVVTKREHAVVGAEGSEPGLPHALEADLSEDSPQEEEERSRPSAWDFAQWRTASTFR